MVIIKRLTATLAAGATSLTFTDAAINSNSVIEIYTSDMDAYPIAQAQTAEHSVTVTFNEQQDPVSVLCLVNNTITLSQPEAASNVTYDNTESGLVSENVQGAIDELVNPEAEDVFYDNTDSGLSATDVQGAIDELAQSGGGDAIDSISLTDYITLNSGFSLVESCIYKQGKHIFGYLCVKKSTAYTSTSSIIGTINTDYKSKVSIIPTCTMGADEWNSRALGYCFIGSDGRISIGDQVGSNNKVAKLHIDYVTA